MSPEEIERRFVYHAPNVATRALHDEWREHTIWLAKRINDEMTGSRETALALTKLEEMAFWVHAHIARNVGEEQS